VVQSELRVPALVAPPARHSGHRRTSCSAFAVIALAFGAIAVAHAQDIEPHAYSNAPIGVNFLVAGVAYTEGGLAFDSSAPITDPDLQTSSAVLGYARVLDFWGKSAKLNVIVPYTVLSGTAEHAGQTVPRDISSFADPLFKLSVNLYGAPALALKEFARYQQDLIVGASLRLTDRSRIPLRVLVLPWSCAKLQTNSVRWKMRCCVPTTSPRASLSSSRVPCHRTCSN
jgi:hypothetical protein